MNDPYSLRTLVLACLITAIQLLKLFFAGPGRPLITCRPKGAAPVRHQ